MSATHSKWVGQRSVRPLFLAIGFISCEISFADTPRVVWSEPTHAGVANSVSFSPDGLLLASGGDSGVVIRSALDGSFIRQILPPGDPGVTNATFSPDGQLVAAGGSGGQMWVWPVTGGDPVLTGVGNNDCEGITFSPDGTMISAAFRDGIQRVWTLQSAQLSTEFQAEVGEMRSCAFSPVSAAPLLVVSGHHAQKWSITPVVDLGPVDMNTWIIHVAFSPNGQNLVTGSTDTNVRMWNMASGALVQTFVGHTFHVQHVAFSADGELIASGGEGVGPLRLWDAARGPASLVAYDGPEVPTAVYGVAFSPTRREFAYARLDGVVVVARLADCALGDVTGDHLIDLSDLATLLTHFGAHGAMFSDGDLDGNGQVDLADLTWMLANFGEVCMN